MTPRWLPCPAFPRVLLLVVSVDSRSRGRAAMGLSQWNSTAHRLSGHRRRCLSNTQIEPMASRCLPSTSPRAPSEHIKSERIAVVIRLAYSVPWYLSLARSEVCFSAKRMLLWSVRVSSPPAPPFKQANEGSSTLHRLPHVGQKRIWTLHAGARLGEGGQTNGQNDDTHNSPAIAQRRLQRRDAEILTCFIYPSLRRGDAGVPSFS